VTKILPPPLLPKRILMTGDPLGGVWTYGLELARSLGGYGIQVDLATMGGVLNRAQRQAAAAVANLRVHESTFKLEWMDDPWDDLERAGDWLLGLEQVLKPDLIHLNTYVHGSLPWAAPVLMVAHSCVLSWWQAVKNESAPPAWEPYHNAVRRGLSAANLVIAPSRAMLREIDRHYGPLPRGRVIANGIDPAAFSPCAFKSPCILAAGRLWDEAKNIRALESVAPKLPWRIYVAGDDRHPGGGGRLPSTRLRLLGRLAAAELTQFYYQAAIYALPARYEPFGLTVLEAALSGCALVLGDIGSLRENWDGAALFVRPDNPEAICTALSRLIDAPDLRKDLAARARHRGLGFDAARMSRAYSQVYEELLKPRASIAAGAHRLDRLDLPHPT
jgi:glycogen(starch) synthase